MKKNWILVQSLLLLLCIGGLSAQESKIDGVKMAVRMADSEIKQFPDPWTVDFNPKPVWNYTQGLIAQSMVQLWTVTHQQNYYSYAEKYAICFIDPIGSIMGYKPDEHNIDAVNSGKFLFDIYETTKDDRYQKTIKFLRDQLKVQPRTKEGGFWHKQRYPDQMWLDGLYMGAPFYAQYAAKFNETTAFDDVVNQFITVHKHTYNAATGLNYHGWDESKVQKWADPQTGCSPNFWSRAEGWYAMALVDVLDFLPQDHAGRAQLVGILKQVAAGIKKWQDPSTGLWYQVLDQGNRQGNYFEASGSSMFVYALFKAVRKGYINKEYKETAIKGYNGIVKKLIRENNDGTISLTGCCSVAGLGGNPYRSGTYEYYISEPVRDNDPKGVGPFIMASLEYKQFTPISMNPFSDSRNHWYGIKDDGNIVNPIVNQPVFSETEIIKIADNILLYQRNNGGWPKNYDMQAILTGEQVESLIKTKGQNHTTFDNSTTYTHVQYLAQAYIQTSIEKYKEACLQGIRFMLKAQYPNGGWPQYFPLEAKNYSSHITFNDGAYIGVMETLKKINDNDPMFSFVGNDMRKEVKNAYDKGLECILKCQIVSKGRLTAWCQQHSEFDLKPAWARAYEMPSICNGESVQIVLFLMSLDHPDERIIRAVQSAVKWFSDSKIYNTRVKTVSAPPEKSQWRTSTIDRVVVVDSTAPPIWTRFYELETERPLFSDRNSKMLYSMAEVSRERRSGYGWYTYAPQTALDKFPEWQKKWAPEKNCPNLVVSANGRFLTADAFAKAIDALSKKGGGRVIVPRGTWFTGPITLKSNIELYTGAGALILFSTDKKLYPLVSTNFEGFNTCRCASPVNGRNLENVAITGKGVLDGSGDVWRAVKKEKLTEAQWKKLVSSGGLVSENGKTWYPSEQFRLGEKIAEMNVPRQLKTQEEFEKIRDFLRPVMISLVSCEKVLIDGPTFQNSPAWCIHPLLCENLTVRNTTVRNPWYS